MGCLTEEEATLPVGCPPDRPRVPLSASLAPLATRYRPHFQRIWEGETLARGFCDRQNEEREASDGEHQRERDGGRRPRRRRARRGDP